MIALIAVGLTWNKPLPENVKYEIVLEAERHRVGESEECKVKGLGISKCAQKIFEIGIYLTMYVGKKQRSDSKVLAPRDTYLSGSHGRQAVA